jgi:hypothetical protein
MEGFSSNDVASRRDTLAGIGVITGAALLQPVRQWASLALPARNPSAIGSDVVAELEKAVMLFRRWDDSGVGGLRRKAVVGQLNAVAEILGEHHPPALAGRLFQVTASLAQLAGWMAYDQGLHGVAQRYYLLGLHACREGGCPDLGAKIIGDMAQLSSRLGHHDDSLALVRAALSGLPRHDASLVRSELLGVESRAYAQLGVHEASNAERSAQACVAVYAERAYEPAPDWHYYMDQAEVDCQAARAYIELALRADDRSGWQRFAAEAEAHCLRACRTRGDGFVRSRVLDEIRLANVRLAQREPAESAAVAMRAVGLAGDVRSSLIVSSLMRFSRDLTSRHADVPDVVVFRDQLRDYLREAAPARLRSCRSLLLQVI